LSAASERYARVACEVGAAAPADSREVAGGNLVEWLRRLNQEMGIASLADFGVDRATYDEKGQAMAAAALASGSPANNPRLPNADEIVRIYAAAFA
jgi:alcohol dehydrogenase class IV